MTFADIVKQQLPDHEIKLNEYPSRSFPNKNSGDVGDRCNSMLDSDADDQHSSNDTIEEHKSTVERRVASGTEYDEAALVENQQATQLTAAQRSVARAVSARENSLNRIPELAAQYTA